MSTGLIALLDDIAAIAKLAATSLDDAAAQAAKASSKAVSKAAGIVVDDAAVTPRYVVGFAAQRELSIVGQIAWGSLKNKLLILMPCALVLNFLWPSIINPLLMVGGAFLCFEGWHKVAGMVGLTGAESPVPEEAVSDSAEQRLNSKDREELRVRSAVRTDFILSAEIMAITLATVATYPQWLQGAVLGAVGLGMTFLVYGAVAIIVKLDDFGAFLARQKNGPTRMFGRGIVTGMPFFLEGLSFVGMIAMLWVGGGILVHGLHAMGMHSPEDWINKFGSSAGTIAGSMGEWLAKVTIAALIGLAVGALVDLLLAKLFNPVFSVLKRMARGAFS
jgi:uncharacterized protein